MSTISLFHGSPVGVNVAGDSYFRYIPWDSHLSYESFYFATGFKDAYANLAMIFLSNGWIGWPSTSNSSNPYQRPALHLKRTSFLFLYIVTSVMIQHDI